MTGYTPVYATSDLSEITVDVIASGGVEAVNFAGLFVLLGIIGALVGTVAVLIRKFR